MKTRIKLLLLGCIVFCAGISAKAQDPQPATIEGQKHTIKIEIQDPQFPGGNKAMFAFLSKKMKYPPKALAAKKECKAVFKFLVSEDGSISKITPLTKNGYGFTEEGIRIIGLMPKWNPARRDGRPVKMYYTLPINFRIKK